jgi:hypothetical protein
MTGSQGADFCAWIHDTLAFAPCPVEGLTTKNRCIVAVATAVGIATLHPGAAAIV